MIANSWLIPVLPALAFAVIAIFTHRFRALSALLSIGTMLVCFLISCGILLETLAKAPADRTVSIPFTWLQIPPWTANVGVLIDPLSVNMLLVVTLVSLLVQIYSWGYMHDDERFATYYSYLSLFTSSMLILVVSTNYLQIFVGWELVGLCSYLLIGFWYFKPEAAEACKKAFIVNRVGDMGFLMGVITIGMYFQTFDFAQVQDLVTKGIASGAFDKSSHYIAGIAILLFCGAVGKSAQFPLHVWLPDAMEGPTPVSALIHAATMVAAGVYMVARTFTLFSADPLSMTVVAYCGGFTAFFAASIAITQDDIKRILAYSTLSQLGYMIMALGVGGYTSGMFHLTTHACFKALLFLGAGSVIHGVHGQDIWKMGGLWNKMKITAATFLVANLAISGIPPFAGFFSKDAILDAVKESAIPGHEILYYTALFTAFLTAFYMFRLFFVVFTGKPRDHHAYEHAHESPVTMWGPLVLLAGLSICVGWLNWPGLDYYSKFVYFGEPHLEGGASSFGQLLTQAWSSLLVAILGITLSALFYWKPVFSADKVATTFRPIFLLLKNKYYVDEFYGWMVKKFVFGFATVCTWFDDNIVDDGMVDGSGWVTQKMGNLLRLTQTGYVQNYALVIFGAVAVIYLMVSF
ncbi:MAG TPA: NADH-quinone oxidoreductase subunit L [bacterium]|nr:NADH-quinone oxidoreductase subunit L [bacterium]